MLFFSMLDLTGRPAPLGPRGLGGSRDLGQGQSPFKNKNLGPAQLQGCSRLFDNTWLSKPEEVGELGAESRGKVLGLAQEFGKNLSWGFKVSLLTLGVSWVWWAEGRT